MVVGTQEVEASAQVPRVEKGNNNFSYNFSRFDTIKQTQSCLADTAPSSLIQIAQNDQSENANI